MKHLFGALADWVEDKVRDRKLRWLIAVPSAAATTLGVIGVAGKIQPLANVSLLALSAFLFLVVLILGINRRHMRRELGQTTQVLRNYGERIRLAQETNKDLFHTTEWSETVSVSVKGDTTIVRDVTVRAGDGPVSAIWLLLSRNSSAHLSTSIRESVRVEACYLDEDGLDGTSIVSTKSWESDHKLRAYLHFDRDVTPSETVQLRLTVRWPKYSADILDGSSEVNSWVFRRQTDVFDSTMRFDQSFSRKPLRVTTLNGSPTPEKRVDPASGETEIHLKLSQIEVDREYGYRVDLQPERRS